MPLPSSSGLHGTCAAEAQPFSRFCGTCSNNVEVLRCQCERFSSRVRHRISRVRLGIACAALDAGAGEPAGIEQLEPIDNYQRAQLQALMDATFLRRRSCDRRGPMPGRLRLKRAFRAPEAGSVWSRFVATAVDIAYSHICEGGCPPVGPRPLRTLATAGELLQLRHSNREAEAHELNALAQSETQAVSLETKTSPSNCCYLFHGTNPEDAVSIALEGFRLERCGSSNAADATLQASSKQRSKGRMFNTGIYLAECSSKADEYASDGFERKRGRVGSRRGRGSRAPLAMLLCRVVLGHVLRVTRAVGGEGKDGALTATLAAATPPRDSLLGDLEIGDGGTYREFVVPRSDQVFPEFVLFYDRLYGPPGGPWTATPVAASRVARTTTNLR